ncbi:unnamed protein product [Amoebophrya sp. A25]|nr:unnamed protein product [Amoebophrya sp. A25]|eukprot:GSA25T00008680001.1
MNVPSHATSSEDRLNFQDRRRAFKDTAALENEAVRDKRDEDEFRLRKEEKREMIALKRRKLETGTFREGEGSSRDPGVGAWISSSSSSSFQNNPCTCSPDVRVRKGAAKKGIPQCSPSSALVPGSTTGRSAIAGTRIGSSSTSSLQLPGLESRRGDACDRCGGVSASLSMIPPTGTSSSSTYFQHHPNSQHQPFQHMNSHQTPPLHTESSRNARRRSSARFNGSVDLTGNNNNAPLSQHSQHSCRRSDVSPLDNVIMTPQMRDVLSTSERRVREHEANLFQFRGILRNSLMNQRDCTEEQLKQASCLELCDALNKCIVFRNGEEERDVLSLVPKENYLKEEITCAVSGHASASSLTALAYVSDIFDHVAVLAESQYEVLHKEMTNFTNTCCTGPIPTSTGRGSNHFGGQATGAVLFPSSAASASAVAAHDMHQSSSSPTSRSRATGGPSSARPGPLLRQWQQYSTVLRVLRELRSRLTPDEKGGSAAASSTAAATAAIVFGASSGAITAPASSMLLLQNSSNGCNIKDAGGHGAVGMNGSSSAGYFLVGVGGAQPIEEEQVDLQPSTTDTTPTTSSATTSASMDGNIVAASATVPLLVHIMTNANDLKAQFEACWILCNVASDQSRNSASYLTTLCRHGAHEGFLQLLHSEAALSVCICEQAVWSLANIAGEASSIAFRDGLLNMQVVELLGKVCNATSQMSHWSNTGKTKVYRTAFWALQVLCRGKPAPALEKVEASLSVFVEAIVRNLDLEITEDAVMGLNSFFSASNPKKMLQAGPTHPQAESDARRRYRLLMEVSTSSGHEEDHMDEGQDRGDADDIRSKSKPSRSRTSVCNPFVKTLCDLLVSGIPNSTTSLLPGGSSRAAGRPLVDESTLLAPPGGLVGVRTTRNPGGEIQWSQEMMCATSQDDQMMSSSQGQGQQAPTPGGEGIPGVEQNLLAQPQPDVGGSFNIRFQIGGSSSSTAQNPHVGGSSGVPPGASSNIDSRLFLSVSSRNSGCSHNSGGGGPPIISKGNLSLHSSPISPIIFARKSQRSFGSSLGRRGGWASCSSLPFSSTPGSALHNSPDQMLKVNQAQRAASSMGGGPLVDSSAFVLAAIDNSTMNVMNNTTGGPGARNIVPSCTSSTGINHKPGAAAGGGAPPPPTAGRSSTGILSTPPSKSSLRAKLNPDTPTDGAGSSIPLLGPLVCCDNVDFNSTMIISSSRDHRGGGRLLGRKRKNHAATVLNKENEGIANIGVIHPQMNSNPINTNISNSILGGIGMMSVDHQQLVLPSSLLGSGGAGGLYELPLSVSNSRTITPPAPTRPVASMSQDVLVGDEEVLGRRQESHSQPQHVGNDPEDADHKNSFYHGTRRRSNANSRRQSTSSLNGAGGLANGPADCSSLFQSCLTGNINSSASEVDSSFHQDYAGGGGGGCGVGARVQHQPAGTTSCTTRQDHQIEIIPVVEDNMEQAASAVGLVLMPYDQGPNREQLLQQYQNGGDNNYGSIANPSSTPALAADNNPPQQQSISAQLRSLVLLLLGTLVRNAPPDVGFLDACVSSGLTHALGTVWLITGESTRKKRDIAKMVGVLAHGTPEQCLALCEPLERGRGRTTMNNVNVGAGRGRTIGGSSLGGGPMAMLLGGDHEGLQLEDIEDDIAQPLLHLEQDVVNNQRGIDFFDLLAEAVQERRSNVLAKECVTAFANALKVLLPHAVEVEKAREMNGVDFNNMTIVGTTGRGTSSSSTCTPSSSSTWTVRQTIDYFVKEKGFFVIVRDWLESGGTDDVSLNCLLLDNLVLIFEAGERQCPSTFVDLPSGCQAPTSSPCLIHKGRSGVAGEEAGQTRAGGLQGMQLGVPLDENALMHQLDNATTSAENDRNFASPEITRGFGSQDPYMVDSQDNGIEEKGGAVARNGVGEKSYAWAINTSTLAHRGFDSGRSDLSMRSNEGDHLFERSSFRPNNRRTGLVGGGGGAADGGLFTTSSSARTGSGAKAMAVHDVLDPAQKHMAHAIRGRAACLSSMQHSGSPTTSSSYSNPYVLLAEETGLEQTLRNVGDRFSNSKMPNDMDRKTQRILDTWFSRDVEDEVFSKEIEEGFGESGCRTHFDFS